MPTISSSFMQTMYFIEAELTSTDITTLGASPIEIIPAYGANTLINLVTVSGSFRYNTTPYTGGSDIVLSIGSIDMMTVFFQSVVNGTESTITSGWFGAMSSMNTPTSTVVNQPVMIGLLGSSFIPEFTGGDSTIKITAMFQVLNVS